MFPSVLPPAHRNQRPRGRRRAKAGPCGDWFAAYLLDRRRAAPEHEPPKRAVTGERPLAPVSGLRGLIVGEANASPEPEVA